MLVDACEWLVIEAHQQGLPEVLCLLGVLVTIGQHEITEIVILRLLVLHEQGMLTGPLSVTLSFLHRVGHIAE